MNFKKVIVGFTLSLLLGSAMARAADLYTGISAFVSGDYKTALAELTPIAEQGDASAQLYLGSMYDDGDGVPENDKTAVKWYTKAAEQGNAGAQWVLGGMYDRGLGVLENDKTAVKWYSLAAIQGNASAQYYLGYMYANGTGLLTDYPRAYMWWNLAAYNGEKIASDNKGKLATEMTPADISKAQEMSIRCMESNYTEC
jgi:TPR repeat protein